MEHKYKLTDSKAIIFDPEYKELGPLGLVAVLLEWHSNLLADRMWTALIALHQSNLASSARGTSNGGGCKCYICQDPVNLANRCPQRNNNGNMSSDQTVKSRNHSSRPLEEWKYCQPADLTKAFKIYGKEWKFCPKCKCRATGKQESFS